MYMGVWECMGCMVMYRDVWCCIGVYFDVWECIGVYGDV